MLVYESRKARECWSFNEEYEIEKKIVRVLWVLFPCSWYVQSQDRDHDTTDYGSCPQLWISTNWYLISGVCMLSP